MATPNPSLLSQFQSPSDQIGGESTGQSLEALDNCKFLDDKYDWLVKFRHFPTSYSLRMGPASKE